MKKLLTYIGLLVASSVFAAEFNIGTIGIRTNNHIAFLPANLYARASEWYEFHDTRNLVHTKQEYYLGSFTGTAFSVASFNGSSEYARRYGVPYPNTINPHVWIKFKAVDLSGSQVLISPLNGNYPLFLYGPRLDTYVDTFGLMYSDNFFTAGVWQTACRTGTNAIMNGADSGYNSGYNFSGTSPRFGCRYNGSSSVFYEGDIDFCLIVTSDFTVAELTFLQEL